MLADAAQALVVAFTHFAVIVMSARENLIIAIPHGHVMMAYEVQLSAPHLAVIRELFFEASQNGYPR